MARPGINYRDVADAAQQLVAQGKNPTIENIRTLTGTGSSTTLAQHLKAWKAQQDTAKLHFQKENLPEEIVVSLKSIWGQVLEQAENQITAVKEEVAETIATLREQNESLQTDNTRWQQQHNQLLQSNAELIQDNATLEQMIRCLEDEKLVLKTTQENTMQQLEEKQNRIAELQHIAQQAQANLEHYREAAREQRQLDQQRAEQTQKQLEQTIPVANQF